MVTKQLKHHMIFPVICFELILLFLFEYHVFIFGIILLVIFRILKLHQPVISGYCLVCCLLAVGFFFINKSMTQATITQSDKAQIRLYPDTLAVDGDVAKGYAKSLETKETYYFQYKIKTKEEKDYIEYLVSPLSFIARIEENQPNIKRNLNGFDFARYLKMNQVSGVYQIEDVYKVVDSNLYLNRPSFFLSSIRQRLSVFIHTKFKPLSASYMDNLILGKQSLEIREVWQRLSLAHLFALSGVHVSFMILLTRHFLLRIGLNKEITSFFEVITILIFICLSGFAVGVVRAGMQELIKRLNKYFELELSNLDCFSLTLFIHSLFAPFLLLTIGGQLSYYLSFLILFIQPTITHLPRLHQTVGFQFLLTFFSLPLICFYFYQWHLLSALLSLIVTPILFGFILPLLVFSLLFSVLLPSIYITVLEYLLLIVHQVSVWLSQFHLFTITTGKLPLWLLVIVIIGQCWVFILWEENKLNIKRLFFCMILMSSFMIIFKYVNPRGMVAIVDIGQGDAIFIQLPFHQGNYLIDTGGQLAFEKEEWQERSQHKRNAEYTLIPFLKSQGVAHLSTVFLTHAHEDHFGDLDVVHREIPVKQVIGTTSTISSSNVQSKIGSLDIPDVQSLKIPSQFKKQGMLIEAIYPKVATDGQNNDSLVLQITLHKKTYLFTGDLEKEGEEELMRDLPHDLLAVDYLKVGHHGSKTSTHSEFVKMLNPKEAFISCGVNNRFNHPSKETLETLSDQDVTIYRTDENGMIYQTWFYFGRNISKTKTIH